MQPKKAACSAKHITINKPIYIAFEIFSKINFLKKITRKQPHKK